MLIPVFVRYRRGYPTFVQVEDFVRLHFSGLMEVKYFMAFLFGKSMIYFFHIMKQVLIIAKTYNYLEVNIQGN